MIDGLKSSVSYENEESYIYADINFNKKQSNKNKLGKSLYNLKNT